MMSGICATGDNRFKIISDAKDKILNDTNISSSNEEMKVLDQFLLRMWQMGWLPGCSGTAAVGHAHWIGYGNCWDRYIMCSNCSDVLMEPDWVMDDEDRKECMRLMKYCGNCGSRMDEEAELNDNS